MNSLQDVPGGYFDEQAYAYPHERITFHDVHRPLSAYSAALETAGLAIEALREPIPGPDLLGAHPTAERWTGTPCFLHFRAVKRG